LGAARVVPAGDLRWPSRASYRSEGRDLLRALRCARVVVPHRRSGARTSPPTWPIPPTSRSPTKARRGSTRLASPTSRAHGDDASVSVTWQAGEYIKFTAGGSYTRVQSHVITADQPCNPISAGDLGRSGRVRSGRINGGHRHGYGIRTPTTAPRSTPWARFRADDTNLFDAWIMGIVMF